MDITVKNRWNETVGVAHTTSGMRSLYSRAKGAPRGFVTVDIVCSRDELWEARAVLDVAEKWPATNVNLTIE